MARPPKFLNTNALWGAVGVRTLRRCGLTHVVISPGSRSTPLAHAFAAHGEFKVTVALDERSAGFIALGIAKATRRPWDMSKGFDQSAVVGLIHPQSALADGTLTLQVDGVTHQTTLLSKMIWNVAGVIAHLSRLVTLAPGDLIFTGTPAGVGPLQRGQTCTVTIDGLSPATVTIF